MKKMMLAAVVTLFCTTLAAAQDDHGEKKKIIGSGNVITKEFPIKSFDELSAGGVYNLVLIQGDKEGVKIEADDNLMDLFEVSNEGSKLNIAMKKDVNFDSKEKSLKVYVSFRKLKALDLKMVGNTSAEGQMNFDNLTINNKSVGNTELKLTVQKLDIRNKGVGDIKLSGKADEVIIYNKGVGSIVAANFVAQKMEIENTGVGSAEVNAEKELKVKDSFLGKVKNRGAAPVKRKVTS